jgi:NDP-sugar pyrophosphorylase family protein
LTIRAIIPVAGNGLRLRPITNRRPKALIEVAGKPVLNYILENLARTRVEELVLIVGYMKEDLIEWVNTTSSFSTITRTLS